MPYAPDDLLAALSGNMVARVMYLIALHHYPAHHKMALLPYLPEPARGGIYARQYNAQLRILRDYLLF